MENREVIKLDGDFNATTIKHFVKNPMLNKMIGRSTKSKINENREKLKEFCSLHNLHIPNKFCKRKPIQ